MKTILGSVAVTALLITSAFAEFYIVQDSSTKRCTIVEQRPAPGVGVVVGDRGFGVRVEAETHMKTVEVCREGTTGRRDGVIIEERR